MAANAVVNISYAVDESPTKIATYLDEQGAEGGKLLRALSKILAAGANSVRSCRVSARVDSATAGGSDAVLDRASSTVAITQASLVATTDTLVFGGAVTLTWVVASANENQVTIGASDTLCGDNLVTIINAHSVLGGIFYAENASGTVTITYRGDPRIGSAIALTETGNGQVITGTTFALDVTNAYAGDSMTFRKGL